MNNEIKITLIASVIIFAGIGFLAQNTINSVQSDTQPSDKVSNQPSSVETIPDKSEKQIVKFPQTTLKKLDDNLSIEKTTVLLSIPSDNSHPWGFIEGKVKNPAPGYPVIVQFFKSLDENPVHLAQIDLNDDNSFDYTFRLLSVEGGKTTHFFEGDYYVKIFKTIRTDG